MFKKCHAMVTHSNSAKARFTKKFTELGYSVNNVTGDIVCSNAGDVVVLPAKVGLLVHDIA